MNYNQIIDRLDIELKNSGQLKLYYYIPSQSNPADFVAYEFVRDASDGLNMAGSVPISIIKEVLAFYQPNKFQCRTTSGRLSFSRTPSRNINMLLGDGRTIDSNINLDTEIWRYIDYRAIEMRQMRNEGKMSNTNSRYNRLPQEVINIFNESKVAVGGTQELQQGTQQENSQGQPRLNQNEDKKSSESKVRRTGLSQVSQEDLAMLNNIMDHPMGNQMQFVPQTRSFSELFSLLSSAPQSGMYAMTYPMGGFPFGNFGGGNDHGAEYVSFSYPQPSSTLLFTQQEYDSLPRRQLTVLEKEYIEKSKEVEKEAAKLPGLEKTSYEIKEKGKLDTIYTPSCQIKNVICSICLDYLEDTINILDCDHAFHWKCLERHVKTCSTKCPHCNVTIIPESDPSNEVD